MQVRSKRKSVLVGNPFEQRAEDAKIFSGYHVGVKLCQFPKMRHISRKDLLGKQFSLMQKRYGTKVVMKSGSVRVGLGSGRVRVGFSGTSSLL